MSDFKPGDRVQVPFQVGIHPAGPATVVVVRRDGTFTAWVDSQDCEFEYAAPEVTLIARAVYMTPERIEALEHCREIIGMFGVSEVIATDVRLALMLAEARGEA